MMMYGLANPKFITIVFVPLAYYAAKGGKFYFHGSHLN